MPKYRVEIKIYDDNNGEVVARTDEILDTHSDIEIKLDRISQTACRVFRSFMHKLPAYLAECYPLGVKEEKIYF